MPAITRPTFGIWTRRPGNFDRTNAQISLRVRANVHATGPAEISIAQEFSGPAQISIITAVIDPSTAAYGVHLSQGTVLMHWQHPAPAEVSYYELFAADNIDGPYFKYQQGEFTTTRGQVTNVPLGISAYFRLRAVGKNGAVSSMIPVQQGRVEKPLVQMNVTGIVGSIIPNGAIFTDLDEHVGRLVAVAAAGLITIS